jgi:hypothetical protein
MSQFKFFNEEKEFDGIVLSDDMLNTIYRLCELEINHMEEHTEKFFRDNPQIDRDEPCSIPMPHNRVDDVTLVEGIISYYGVDFNMECDNVMEHSLSFHPNGRGTNNYMMRFDDDIKQEVYCTYNIVVRQSQPSNELNIFSVTIDDDI